MFLPDEATLQRNQLMHTTARQSQQLVELLPRKRLMLGRPLNLDEMSIAGHDDVHIDVAGRILLVGQIEEPLIGSHPHARRRHKIPQGNSRDDLVRSQTL